MYEIKENYSLKDLNSLNVNASARYYIEVDDQDDLIKILKSDLLKENRYFILGGGCNILFVKDFLGVVLKIGFKGIAVLEESEESVLLQVATGESWHDLVTYAVNNGWGGIENMALIPGLVGAAPIQNIAAYGENYSDVAEDLDAIRIYDGEKVTFSKEDCKFRYRESIFKHQYDGQYLITSVRIRLNKNPLINSEYWSHKHGSVSDELKLLADEPYTIKDVYNAVISLRNKKFPDPKLYGTAGSFFKNPLVRKEKLIELDKLVPGLQYYPVDQLHYIENIDPEDLKENYVKVAAGQLIDEGLGLKGYWRGNVGIHEEHALILATKGEAIPEEVYQFAKWVQEQFYKKFGVELENEVRFIQ